jgi:hypothetical protein
MRRAAAPAVHRGSEQRRAEVLLWKAGCFLALRSRPGQHSKWLNADACAGQLSPADWSSWCSPVSPSAASRRARGAASTRWACDRTRLPVNDGWCSRPRQARTRQSQHRPAWPRWRRTGACLTCEEKYSMVTDRPCQPAGSRGHGMNGGIRRRQEAHAPGGEGKAPAFNARLRVRSPMSQLCRTIRIAETASILQPHLLCLPPVPAGCDPGTPASRKLTPLRNRACTLLASGRAPWRACRVSVLYEPESLRHDKSVVADRDRGHQEPDASQPSAKTAHGRLPIPRPRYILRLRPARGFRSTSARCITRTAVVSITATGRPAESTTTWRSPGPGSGSFSCSYSASSPVAVVFSPAKIAATS